MTNALSTYLGTTRLIQGSGIASDERSYYPALDALLRASGDELQPKVIPIHDVADRGAGHPDYVLQVETTHDTRAAIEVKPAGYDLATLIQSDQVRRYLDFYGLCLVTNLREFALVERGGHGAVAAPAAPLMRYALAPDDNAFWTTPVETLARQHGEALHDFLISVLTWQAVITRPKDLAEALARYAREARRRLERQPVESLAPLRAALAEALGLHFTDEQGEHFFRSSLVQTLFYGLFSAWVVWSRAGDHADAFRWQAAGDYLSLPVMRELFEHTAIGSQLEALDIRKPLEWAEATLRRTAWEPFAAAFDQGDAVNYFYEPFLEAYDPELRAQLGVWYTPREIIRYQVARVDRLLREELHIADGLAGKEVIVLDPATGTGGYVLEVLRVIDQALADRGALRALELREAATKRVFGFEILPAPFVIAHLQIATLLAARGAPLAPRQRAGVYLTNALTGWKADDGIVQHPLTGFPALKREAETAASVKHEGKILVILGNPPYYGFAGVAEDEEHELLAPYYIALRERFGIQAQHLNDLYVRFFRLAERQIAEKTGRGIVSFISNYGWLTGLSHPVMRENVLQAFDQIWVDNLHGDRIISERTPNGRSCETIFAIRGQSTGIKVGTAITTMVRRHDRTTAATQVLYRDVWGMPDEPETWGRAEQKRAALVWSGTLPSERLTALYRDITPTQEVRFVLVPGGTESAYLTWPSLNELYIRSYSGVKTARDTDLICIDREPLRERMRHYFDSNLSDADVASHVPMLMADAAGFAAAETRRELLSKSGYHDSSLVRVAYRPLDDRWLYWEELTHLLDRNRADFFAQVFPGNLYLAASTKGRRGGVNLPTITDKFGVYHLQDPYSIYFPLYTHEPAHSQQSMFAQAGPQPNLSDAILQRLTATFGLSSEDREPLAVDLFFHILAVTRAPLYESENAGYLEQDWPRIPIPATHELLAASAVLGRRVADLLRPDVPFAPSSAVRGIGVPARVDGGQLGEDDLRVTVRYGGVGRYEPPLAGPPARPGRVWWNDAAYWDNVPAEVWAFTIGGYPVLKKWLDYRHSDKLGRPLRPDEVAYVGEMAQRIATLLALGPTLDANYSAVKANTLALGDAR